MSPEEAGRFVEGAAELIREGDAITALRIPEQLARQIPDPTFQWVARTTAGVRLRFRANGPVVLTVRPVDAFTDRAALSLRLADAEPFGSMDAPATAASEAEPVPITLTITPRSSRDAVTVLLDHRSSMRLLSLRGDLSPAPSEGSRWLHHGSSISHGLEALAPHRRWTEQVAARLGLRVTDLSLAGHAQVDQAIARAIRATEADLITAVLGINVVNSDSLRERTFVPAVHGFLDTIREGHPTTPFALVGAIACPAQEAFPGPLVVEEDGRCRPARREVEADTGALTLARTRELLEQVVASRNDPHLRYVDGRRFFGAGDRATLHDDLHPDQVGIDLIAERVTPVLEAFLAEIQRSAPTAP